MSTITLVTGNHNKLREYQALIPEDAGISLDAEPLDLTEIQSLDVREIVAHKLKEAYAQLGHAVIVDDVAAGLDSLSGLPGPFIKFFMQKLGKDALYQLATTNNKKVTITCTTGYYDDTNMLFGEGIIEGTVVAPRGSNNFGFDSVVLPNGSTQTLAEMSAEEKNAISHRSLAITDLLAKIASLRQT